MVKYDTNEEHKKAYKNKLRSPFPKYPVANYKQKKEGLCIDRKSFSRGAHK